MIEDGDLITIKWPKPTRDFMVGFMTEVLKDGVPLKTVTDITVRAEAGMALAMADVTTVSEQEGELVYSTATCIVAEMLVG